MGIYNIQTGIPAFKNAVLTIGSFDGMHKGHQVILDKVINESKVINGESVLITFDPHPRQVIRPDVPIELILDLEEKYERILAYGIDHIVIVPFTRSFSLLTAEDYIEQFLIEKFNPVSIIIGYDHQFGCDRKGNIDLLKEKAQHVKIIEIEEQVIDDNHVSSTQIRKAIHLGHFNDVTRMLGTEYCFKGIVIHGKKLGRTIGYPTANIQPSNPNQILPPIGIYAVRVILKDNIYNGVMSIGKNPTVTNTQQLHYEVHIFDFDKDIYGEILKVAFIKKIRDEKKFENLQLLIEQIDQDASIAKQILTDY